VSTKRKLKRAQKKQTDKRQTSADRFAKPGAEKLWVALLGWSGERLVRAQLLDSLHDQVLGGGDARSAFAARRPDLSERLTAEDVETAVGLWQEGTSHFHYVAALCARLGLGEPSAEDLERDWGIWTSLSRASGPHKMLLASLAQTEAAAAALGDVTQSEDVAAIAQAMRVLWSALAYGDENTLRRVRSWSEEWAAR
jgi:hypothetical protein